MKPTSNQTQSISEVVILVHGTFAGDSADEGPKWWQKGSNTWLQIQRALPSGIGMGDVFHWAEGPNSYRARTKAAHALLKKLLDLERKQQGYHLIGHSHGGSVIWECLRQAIYKREDRRTTAVERKPLSLENLKSWTTVGTPFVQFAPKMPGHKDPVTQTKPLRRFLMALFSGSWLFGSRIYQQLLSFSTLFLVIFIFLIPFLVIIGAIVEYSAGVAIPWYELVFGSLVWLLSLLVVLIGGEAWIRFTESSEALRERKHSNLAIEEFGSKWLGIISKNDEAFAAIKASLSLKLSIITNREATTMVFHSDHIFRSIHWLRRILDFIYNLFVPRFGNRFISNQIAKSIQGNDRPASMAISVTSNPCSSDEFSMPLPEEIDAELVSLANKRAADLIPHFRSLLYSIDGANLQVLGQLEVDPTFGLVHNSYFDIGEVLEIVAHHVCTTSDVGSPVCEDNTLIPDWVQAFKTDFQRCIDRRAKWITKM